MTAEETEARAALADMRKQIEADAPLAHESWRPWIRMMLVRVEAIERYFATIAADTK